MGMAQEHFWIGRMCHAMRRISASWKHYRDRSLDDARRIQAALTGYMTRYAWNFTPFQGVGISAVLYAEALHQSETMRVPIDMMISQYANGYHQCTPPGIARYARAKLGTAPMLHSQDDGAPMQFIAQLLLHVRESLTLPT